MSTCDNAFHARVCTRGFEPRVNPRVRSASPRGGVRTGRGATRASSSRERVRARVRARPRETRADGRIQNRDRQIMMYAVVTAIAPCERAYASRTNTTRIKRVLAIDCSLPRDDRVVSRALTLWNHRAVTMIDCRPGDLLACDARAIRPRRARGRLARDDRSLHAREDATFERLARAEDLLGRGWGRIGRVRDGVGVPSFRGCRAIPRTRGDCARSREREAKTRGSAASRGG